MIRRYLTAKGSQDRLSEKKPLTLKPDAKEQENELINLHDDVTFQTIVGFGGAFTEAAAVTLDKLSPENREKLLEAYFSPQAGLGYSLCRTHINSCDFSLENYAYVEKEDPQLASFSIDRDRRSLIPFIRDAAAVPGANFKILSSPWSPPAWMKTSGKMNEGGKLKPEWRDAWARYFVRYVQEYAKEGIPIWAVTVQNEAKAVQTWDSCVYTAAEEKDFVRDHLGPALHEAGLQDVKILIWDHNKERVYERAVTAFSDAEASRYLWGIAFHWYSGDHFGALDCLRQRFPDKQLLFTEATAAGAQGIGQWKNGEHYGHDMIGNLNAGTCGFIDWNLLLDETGGPNHVGNLCTAAVIADTQKDALTFESPFYYQGHFSRFIRPGAVRIGCSSYSEALEATAFCNEDRSIAVVVLNRSDSPLPFTLRHQGQIASCESPAHSIQTLVLS